MTKLSSESGIPWRKMWLLSEVLLLGILTIGILFLMEEWGKLYAAIPLAIGWFRFSRYLRILQYVQNVIVEKDDLSFRHKGVLLRTPIKNIAFLRRENLSPLRGIDASGLGNVVIEFVEKVGSTKEILFTPANEADIDKLSVRLGHPSVFN